MGTPKNRGEAHEMQPKRDVCDGRWLKDAEQARRGRVAQAEAGDPRRRGASEGRSARPGLGAGACPPMGGNKPPPVTGLLPFCYRTHRYGGGRRVP